MIIGCIQSCNDVYTMLTEIKTDDQHYFVDDHHRIQGEYKRYHVNGQLRVHSFFQNGNYHGEYKSYQKNGRPYVYAFFKNGILHGEYKHYHRNGKQWEHSFYYQGTNLNVDPNTLTEQDKTYILLSGRLPPRD